MEPASSRPWSARSTKWAGAGRWAHPTRTPRRRSSPRRVRRSRRGPDVSPARSLSLLSHADTIRARLQERCNVAATSIPTMAPSPTDDRKGVMHMAITEEKLAGTEVVYDLQGTLLEACSCGVLCPCWIGEDPDGGSCDAFVAYHFDAGTVRGIDVGGLSLVNVCRIPGNVLIPASWKIVMFVDDRATDEQLQALLDAYSGKLGGPLADLAGLVGEVLDVRRARIEHEIRGGAGTLRVGDVLSSEMAPFTGADGSITTLRDSVFSTVPGSPAYVSKASTNTVNLPEFGMVWSFENRNAIQSDYRITFSEPR